MTPFSSIIIHHLSDRTERQNGIPCLYAYLNSQVQETHNPTYILADILAQLISHTGRFSALTHLHKLCTDQRRQPSVEEYLQLLGCEFKPLPKAFLVIDALDECPDYDPSNARDVLLGAVLRLPDNVRILITSRYDRSVERKFNPDSQLEIIANDKDIRNYILTRMDRYEDFKQLMTENDPGKSLLNHMCNTIVKRAQGM